MEKAPVFKRLWKPALSLGATLGLLAATAVVAQQPVGEVETAPALPVETESASPAPDAVETSSGETTASDPIPDYTEQIGNGLKERERRLTLLNEAMMKLRQAGEMEDAGRVEERIRALLEMPPPSQTGSRLRAEIEQLRAKNDELALQVLALQEELKRYRPATQGSTSKRVASDR